MEFIDLKTQQKRIREKILKNIEKVMDHGAYIRGPEVTEFENRLANFVGAKHCINCANGTDALQIALMALDVGANDEIITPGFTYIATAETTAMFKAKPVFVDIDEKTYNIDPAKIEAAITDKTKAIMAVSLYGQCADFDAINAIGKKHNIPVIEDAAQSMGAQYKGRHSCNLSDIATTSFFPSKPLGCYGDGGAIFTNNDAMANTMRQIANHGQGERYHHDIIGINSRLDTMQAAVLMAKMDIFQEEIDLRQQVAAWYATALNEIGVEAPYIESHNLSVYAQYTIRVPEREKIKKFMQDNGVPIAVHYPMPINKQKAYADPSAHLPVGDYAAETVMSLPMHPYLSKDQVEMIISTLARAFESLEQKPIRAQL